MLFRCSTVLVCLLACLFYTYLLPLLRLIIPRRCPPGDPPYLHSRHPPVIDSFSYIWGGQRQKKGTKGRGPKKAERGGRKEERSVSRVRSGAYDGARSQFLLVGGGRSSWLPRSVGKGGRQPCIVSQSQTSAALTG
ncbi:hypothetical protein IWX49DRAFT_328978 [Phyllosticta citricarpa]